VFTGSRRIILLNRRWLTVNFISSYHRKSVKSHSQMKDLNKRQMF
jgi:hypothetical protein